VTTNIRGIQVAARTIISAVRLTVQLVFYKLPSVEACEEYQGARGGERRVGVGKMEACGQMEGAGREWKRAGKVCTLF